MKSAISPRYSMLHPIPPGAGRRMVLRMRRMLEALLSRFGLAQRVSSDASSGRLRVFFSQPPMSVANERTVLSRQRIFGRQGKAHAATVFSAGGFKPRNSVQGLYEAGGLKPSHWQAFLKVAQNRTVVREFEAATTIYNSRNTSAAIIQRVMRTTRGSSV